MTRSNSSKLLAKDPKIEWIALQNLRARIKQRAKELGVDLEDIQLKNMAKPQRIMFEYAKPSLNRAKSIIVRPTVTTNNFDIRLIIIRMVQQFMQFNGLQDEDPNTHIANFLEVYDTFKINGAIDDAIRL